MKTMRVTGGIYRGRRVACPPGIIRPAMDRMRESVFAILGDLSGCTFLDLFCGSGIIGIEAASRGADEITFVEKDGRKLSVLRQNIEIIEAKTQVLHMSAERFLRVNSRAFDIVFADPPFTLKDKQNFAELIQAHGTLNTGGTLLIHYPAEDTIPKGPLTQYDLRKYGRSMVGFYRL